MAHSKGQKIQIPPPILNRSTKEEKPKKPESSGSGSSGQSKSSTAIDAAKKQLQEKRGKGRPVGSTKKPPEPTVQDPKQEEQPANLAKKFNITPQFAGTIYKHIVNGYARSFNTDLLGPDEVKEFEEQYSEWLKLENFTINPLYMARIGMITATLMPIIIRHPMFTQVMMKFAGINAEQDHHGGGTEGKRKDDLGAGGDTVSSKTDSGGSPP